MKLALVISSLNSGGAQRVLSELANYWSSKNHNVSLITLSSPKTQPFYSLNPNIDLIQLGQNGHENSYIKRFTAILKRLFYLRKTIKKIAPDIILSFVDTMNIKTLIATKGFNIPIILSERVDPNFYLIPKIHNWLRLKIYPWSYRLVVQTKSAANYFPKNFQKFIQIIPNPVITPAKQKNNTPKQVKNIIAIGRLNLQKDHTIIIKILAKLASVYPDLTLTIYGEGSERTNLEQLIAKLNLKDRVFLPGTTKDINKALLEADLFIFPSKYEGFPNALCEAMAIGLPVIASNCSGNIDIIRDKIDGRLFPVGDVEALTNITIELIEDHEQRQRLAENAKIVCDRFNADKIFAVWDELLIRGQTEKPA